MTPEAFRKLALSLPDAAEGAHMAHPDFRVGGRIFATMGYPDQKHATVMLSPIEQELFVKAHPTAFKPVAGGWGRQGATTVILAKATVKPVREALSVAWNLKAPKVSPRRASPTAPIAVRPLTPKRWADLETVFQSKGCSIARGCWCMAYRISGRPPAPPPGETASAANRRAFRALVAGKRFTGLIGYRGKTPVGWIALGPRQDFPKLANSPVMKPVDDTPVWSVVCFVVPGPLRGQKVATALLQGAVDFARKKGVSVLEGYPVDKSGRSHDEFLWFGAKSMFESLGFREVARRRPMRPVMRLELQSFSKTKRK